MFQSFINFQLKQLSTSLLIIISLRNKLSKSFISSFYLLSTVVSFFVGSTQYLNAQVIYNNGFEVVSPSGSSFTQTSASIVSEDPNLGPNSSWSNSAGYTFTTYGGNGATPATSLATSSASASTNTWTLTMPIAAGYVANITQISFDTRESATSYGAVQVIINGTSVYTYPSGLNTASFFTGLGASGLTLTGLTSPLTIQFIFSGGGGGAAGTTRLDNIVLYGSVTTAGCTGTPAGGTAAPTTASFCNSGSTTITLTGAASGTGISYQWYQASALAGPYTLIAGAVGTTYTTPTISSTTYYRCTTTCSTSGLFSNSSVATVTINPLPNVGTISGTPYVVCEGASIPLSETSTLGTWSAANGNATVSGGGVVSGVTAGTDSILYSVTNSCGTLHTSVQVTINPAPNAGTISGTLGVCIGDSVALTDAGSVGVGTWSALNSNATVSATGHVTGVTAGTDSILYTVTNSCGTLHTSKMVTINLLPNAGTISGTPYVVCVGASIPLSETSTLGTWSASNANASVSGGGVVTGNTVGTDSIKYTVTNGCGILETSVQVTINPLPNAGTISGTLSVCVGDSVALTNAGSVGVGTWSALNGNATISSTGEVVGVTSGTDSILYTVTNSCGTLHTSKMVTINPLPNAGTISGSSYMVCVGATIPLSETSTLGSWSASNANASVSGGGVVSGNTVGVDSIIYTVTNSCGTLETSVQVTINPLPVAGVITGTLTVCPGDSVALTDITTGGVWSAQNANATVSAIGEVVGNTAGTDSILYSVTNSCGTLHTSVNITINPLPVAGSITGIDSVCQSAVTTLTDLATGGTWSATNTNATVSGGLVTGIIAGTDSILYTVTNSCGTATTSVIVTINPSAFAGPITGLDTVCIGATIVLADTTSGGTWSAVNGNASVVGGVVTGSIAGADTIIYTVITTCGTIVRAHPITVLGLPNTGSITGILTVCVSDSVTLTDVIGSGVWSAVNGNASVSGSGNVIGIAAGTDSIKYSTSNTCGMAFTSVIVTLNPLPVAGTISGFDSVCLGSTIPLTETSTLGTWSVTNANATVSGGGVVSGVNAGTDSVKYTVTNTCGTISTAVLVTVIDTPVAGTITGSTNLCIGSVVPYFNTTAIGTGVWSVSNGYATNSTNLVQGVTAGTDTVIYTVSTYCGAKTAIFPITINPAPPTTFLSGPDSVCASANITLTDTFAGGSWSASNSNATVSGGIVTGAIAGTDSIIHTYLATCGSASSIKLITINPLPNAGIINGSYAVCAGDTLFPAPYSTVSGGTWSVVNTNALVTLTGSVVGISAGFDSLIYTVTNLCGSASTSTILTINALPVVGTTSGSGMVCVSSTDTLNNTISGGTWSASNGNLTISTITGVATGISAGIDTVTYTQTTLTCGSAHTTLIVTVNPLPNSGTITAPLNVCGTSTTVTLTETAPGGIWSASTGTINYIGTNYILSGLTLGTDSLTYSVSNICGTSLTNAVLTVNTLVSAGTINGNDTVCLGAAITLADTALGGIWISSNANATVSLTGVVSGVHPGIDVIKYVVNNVCSTDTTSKSITILTLDSAGTITGLNVVCDSSSLTLSDSHTGGIWSSSNASIATVSSTGVVTGLLIGTAHIIYSKINYCGISTTFHPITVNSTASAIIGSANICKSQTITFTDSSAGGTWTSVDTSIATVSTTGLVYGKSPGTTIISYAVSSGCFATKTISISPVPNAGFIGGLDSIICLGYTIVFNDTSDGGAGTWSSANGSIATVSGGSVTGLALGNTQISYTVVNSCGNAFAYRNVFVAPLPTISPILGSSTVCLAGTTTLIDTSAGGYWSISNGNVAIPTGATTSCVLTGLHLGFDTVTFYVSNGCGYNSVQKVVNVVSSPTIGAIHNSGSDTVCASTAMLLSDTTSGGTWSSSNPFISTVSGTGIVANYQAGNAIITYSYTTTCGTTIATRHITVKANVQSIYGADTVCAGRPIVLADTTVGTWSVTNTHGELYGTTFLGLSAGKDTVKLAASDGCGVALKVITIMPQPNSGIIKDLLGNINSNDTMCISLPTTIVDSTIGGTWSSFSSTTTVYPIIGGAVVVGLTPGIDTIYYTDSNYCGISKAIQVVSIINIPNSGAIIGTDSFCGGTTIPITDTFSSGGIWSLTNNNASYTLTGTGGITLYGISEGYDTILYTVSNHCGTTIDSDYVKIKAAPNAGIILGLSHNLCQGTNDTLIDSLPNGVWQSIKGITTVVDGIVNTSLIGIDTIEYVVNNSCGTNYAYYPITVQPLPIVAPITNSSLICYGSTVTLHEASIGGTWSITNAGLANLTDSVLTANFVGFDTVYYSINNSCGDTTLAFPFSILPPPPTQISGLARVCEGTSDTLNAGTSSGSWSLSNAHASITNSGIVTYNSSGLDTAFFTVNSSCIVTTLQFNLLVFSTWQCDSANFVPTVNSNIGRDINIYPNPNDGIFTVELPETGNNTTLNIIDMYGNIVLTKEINTLNTTTKININNLARGTYLISVSLNNEIYRKKVVIW